MIKITVCTDVAAIAFGAAYIAKAADAVVDCLIGHGADLLETLDSASADVLLFDWNSFQSFTLLAGVMKARQDTPVVVWSRSISPEMASYCLSMGVRGLLRKNSSEAAMIAALQAVVRGEVWVEPDLTAGLLGSRPNLTLREQELILLLARGLRNKEIAEEMGLSEGTVKIYVSRLLQKTGLEGRLELALYGLKHAAGQEIYTAPAPIARFAPVATPYSMNPTGRMARPA